MKLLSFLGRMRWLLMSSKDTYNINQLQKFEAALNQNGYSFRDFQSILDYGCGDGRLIKYMSKVAPQAETFGCDPSGDAIEACKRKWGDKNFIQINSSPPSSFTDNQFDLIYAYSVFTIVSEEEHIEWLKELTRILKPGGIAIHAIKGHEFLRRAEIFSPEIVTDYFKIKEPINEFIENNKGKYYYDTRKPARRTWGISIISKEYVKKEWPKYSGIEVLDFIEGAIETYPQGCHDLVVLKKQL